MQRVDNAVDTCGGWARLHRQRLSIISLDLNPFRADRWVDGWSIRGKGGMKQRSSRKPPAVVEPVLLDAVYGPLYVVAVL